MFLSSMQSEQQQRSFSEACVRATGFRPPVVDSKQRLFEEFQKARDTCEEITDALWDIGLNMMRIPLGDKPELPVFNQRVASMPRDEIVSRMESALREHYDACREKFQAAGAGTTEWSEDGQCCLVQYLEPYSEKGILNERIQNQPIAHSVMKARMRRLGDPEVTFHPLGRDMAMRLPKCLRREARVIVGTMIAKEVATPRTHMVRTDLGKRWDNTKGWMHTHRNKFKYGGMAAAGVAGAGLIGSLIASGIAAASSAAVAAAPVAATAALVADPALVIGDVVLYGWE